MPLEVVGQLTRLYVKNVRKKRSARKRIGFDREKAMEDLNQSSGDSTTPQTKSASNSMDNMWDVNQGSGNNNNNGK